MKKSVSKLIAFSRLKAAERRIAIAKDILKQIKAQNYNIRQGMWLEIDPTQSPGVEENSNILQAALLGGKKTIVTTARPANCTCCAVGAACASAIRLFNRDSLEGNVSDGFEMKDYQQGMSILSKYFTESQVDLLEAAFEQRTDSHHQTADGYSLAKASEFGWEIDDDTERLVAICKNIIKNKGTFKP